MIFHAFSGVDPDQGTTFHLPGFPTITYSDTGLRLRITVLPCPRISRDYNYAAS